MKKGALILVLIAAFVPGCATDGASSVGVGLYGDWYYGDDIWYGGGCCVDIDRPGDRPHPEHPIVLPPDGVGPPRPENPIAVTPEPKSTRPSTSTSSASRSAAPRMSAMPRGGGGGRGGRR
jgi:hypothetical protein